MKCFQTVLVKKKSNYFYFILYFDGPAGPHHNFPILYSRAKILHPAYWDISGAQSMSVCAVYIICMVAYQIH